MNDEAAELRVTAELLEQLERGDPSARQLVARCAEPMLDYLRKTRGRHGLRDADWMDAVQRVFVEFFASTPPLEIGRPLLPYLKVAAISRAKNMVRAQAIRSAHEGAAVLERTAAGAELAGGAIELAERAQRLESKLAMVSDDDRAALVAYARAPEQRHVKVLQAMEGLNQGTAQMRYKRAKERWVDPEGGSEGKETK
jgi:DNA-directed RNA polymerase specialized sigma24 family protein